MRDGVRERVGEVLAANPSAFVEISEFIGKSFYEIERMVPEELFNLNLRSLFQFEWAYGKWGVIEEEGGTIHCF